MSLTAKRILVTARHVCMTEHENRPPVRMRLEGMR
jgi:hypothetical protein